MSQRLSGKRIIITGAATGIGREAARRFVSEGARVVIADLNEQGAKGAVHELGAASHAIRCDVSSEADVAAMIRAGVDWLGGLDVVVNNAGLLLAGNVTDFGADEWDRIMAVNARSCFLTAKHAVPHLRRAGGGSIINTSSVAGQRGGPGATGYCASKGAIIAFSVALALELARDGIRVNAVCPGWVDTAFNDPIIGLMGGKAAQQAMIETYVPMRRQGTPQEIAPMFVFLASDESSYITAKAFGVDGGLYN